MDKLIWIALKEFDRVGSGSCILGARSSERAAMELCMEHDPHHLHYTIESVEINGDGCHSLHGYVDGTLQTTLTEMKWRERHA